MLLFELFVPEYVGGAWERVSGGGECGRVSGSYCENLEWERQGTGVEDRTGKWGRTE